MRLTFPDLGSRESGNKGAKFNYYKNRKDKTLNVYKRLEVGTPGWLIRLISDS